MLSLTAQAQNFVDGVVKEYGNEQEPMVGVRVFNKNTNGGVITNIEGKFSIEVFKGDTLHFSFLGFKDVINVVEDFSFRTITIQENLEILSEVVVVGYGAIKPEDVTGSIVALSVNDFNKGNTVTPSNLIRGRIPGLSINTGGAPGSGSEIRIRGGASLGASNDPLIVIDGLPIDNNTIGGSRSILSTINPNDIASISVLKDASATAIYGSRASNGVIIITTKKGSDKLSVALNINTSYSSIGGNLVDVFSADEYRELVEQRRPELVPRLGEVNTDWQKAIYNNTFSTNVDLSIKGAIGGIPLRLSVGNADQNGLRLTSNYNRSNVSFSANPQFFDDKLKLSLNTNYVVEKNRYASDQGANALTFDPTQPIYDANSPFGGFFQYLNDNDDGTLNENDLVSLAPLNPVAELLQRRSVSSVNRVYGNVKLDYNLHFLPDLSVVVNLGLDKQEAEGSVKVDSLNPLTQRDGRIIGSHSEYSNSKENLLFDGYFNYKKTFGDLNVDLTTGYSYQKFSSNKYDSKELLDYGVDSEPVTTAFPDLVLLGYFSRVNLSLVDKYLLTLTYRRDGTSRFSEKNRWGNFPAVGFAWKINKDLFRNSSIVSNLKLRLGWGITGQQDIGEKNLDLFLSNYSKGLPSSQYQFGNSVIPIGMPRFRNEDLKWEETTTYNAGVDVGILENKYTASIDLFRKESKDLLAPAAISDGSNFSNVGFQNIGSFTSEGIEIGINGDIIEGNGDQFYLFANVNAAILKTELTTLFQNQDIPAGKNIAGGTGNTIQVHRVGYTPYSFFVYKQVYGQDKLPIEGSYVDLNGDNIINDKDRYIRHNNTPKARFGFASNMSYKNFDLSFNLRAVVGNYVYNNVNSAKAQYNLIENSSVLSNLPVSVLETNFNTTENVILSDIYVENASFLKVDNVSLGYSFKEVFKTKTNLRLEASVQNLLTITNYSGLDPEVFNNGIDNSIYPRPRIFLISANIQFN